MSEQLTVIAAELGNIRQIMLFISACIFGGMIAMICIAIDSDRRW